MNIGLILIFLRMIVLRSKVGPAPIFDSPLTLTTRTGLGIIYTKMVILYVSHDRMYTKITDTSTYQNFGQRLEEIVTAQWINFRTSLLN